MLCLYEKGKNNDKMQSGYNLGGGNSRTFLELSTTRYLFQRCFTVLDSVYVYVHHIKTVNSNTHV